MLQGMIQEALEAARRDGAAISIQAARRGRAVRSDREERRSAATLVQAAQWGKLARNAVLHKCQVETMVALHRYE